MRDPRHDPPDETLLLYPYVVVRIGCDRCGRQGAYRLTRLVNKFGLDTDLKSILRRMVADCPYATNDRGMRPAHLLPDEFCEARFVDLDPPQPPADLPPAPKGKLRVVKGGKK